MTVESKSQICNACKMLVALSVLGGWTATTDVYGEPITATETRPAEINSCSLLSPESISEATGFAAQPGIRSDSGYESNGAYSSTCVWMLERERSGADQGGSSLGGRSFVILNAMRWPEGSGLADSFLRAFHEAAASGEIPGEPIPRNYGDAALWWGDGLAVRTGDVSFGISVVIAGVTPGHPGEFEERLTTEILRQLPHPTE